MMCAFVKYESCLRFKFITWTTSVVAKKSICKYLRVSNGGHCTYGDWHWLVLRSTTSLPLSSPPAGVGFIRQPLEYIPSYTCFFFLTRNAERAGNGFTARAAAVLNMKDAGRSLFVSVCTWFELANSRPWPASQYFVSYRGKVTCLHG